MEGRIVAMLQVSSEEWLFLECLLEAISEFGHAPPGALGLPTSIKLVVDYDRVKALMLRKTPRDDLNGPGGSERHRKRVQAAVKRARESLMHHKVVGADSPFLWWTGRAVREVSAPVVAGRVARITSSRELMALA
jgi:hypothetical protein